MLWIGEHRPRKKHRMGRPDMRNVQMSGFSLIGEKAVAACECCSHSFTSSVSDRLIDLFDRCRPHGKTAAAHSFLGCHLATPFQSSNESNHALPLCTTRSSCCLKIGSEGMSIKSDLHSASVLCRRTDRLFLVLSSFLKKSHLPKGGHGHGTGRTEGCGALGTSHALA